MPFLAREMHSLFASFTFRKDKLTQYFNFIREKIFTEIVLSLKGKT